METRSKKIIWKNLNLFHMGKGGDAYLNMKSYRILNSMILIKNKNKKLKKLKGREASWCTEG